MYVSINGKLVLKKDANIPIISKGFMFGHGLFETIKIHHGKPIFIEEHLNRLKDSSKKIGIEVEESFNDIKKRCKELISANNLSFGAVKILYTKDLEGYTLVISTRETSYTHDKYEKGFSLCFSDVKRNPHSILTYIKSNNYLENILAREKAVNKGFDEVVFLNVYNKICEGCISNIFFIKNKKIYTPSIDFGILPGIMRDKIIKLINKLGYDIIVSEFEKDDLLQADEVFITNSLMDIMPVSKIEDKKFDLCNNEITQLLMENFKRIY